MPSSTKPALAAALLTLALAGSAVAQDQKPAEAPPPAAQPAAPAQPGAPAQPDAGDVTVAVPVDVTLTARPVLYVTGKSNWDDAEESLGQSLNAIFSAIGKANLKAAGPAMIEYLDSGDDDFQFKAMVPIEKAPKTAPSKDVKVGESPAGPALKFVHQGSFEDLEEVYNRIDDYLVSKSLSMKKVYEEYETDPVTTAPDKMVTNIYVVTE
ncbi:GyrI-like domain-containing protein [Prosthecomicrobium sp. N25]|uniref:GyrI-like domain-containing protein n=1 Tax=Prosthecomicrobium sp. N25 TaxID=3129254 RepID=UPI003077CAAE